MDKKLYITPLRKVLTVLLLSAVCSLSVVAQQGRNFGVEFGYVRGNTTQSLEEMAGNVLRIVNNTRSPQVLTVNLTIPDGWELFTNLDRTFEVAAQDSVFVPVRVIPAKTSKGNTDYLINAILVDTSGFQLSNDYWYVNVNHLSEWNAMVPNKKVYFINNKNDASFEVFVENTGNADETILLEFSPSRDIIVNDTAGVPVELATSFKLTSRSDTTIKYRVLKIDQRKTAASAGTTEEPVQKSWVKVVATNDAGDFGKAKLWRGNVEFFELANEMQLDGYGYSELPITVELNSFDVLDNTTLTLDIYGTANFNKERSLTYRYQSNYVDNFFDPKRYIGDYHYLGYFSNRGGIELGNVSGGKHGAFIGGKGVRGTLRFKHDAITAMYARNPTLFRGTTQSGFSVNNIYNYKKINNDTYFQWEWDEVAQMNSSVLSTSMAWQLHKMHSLKLFGGVSYEEHHANPVSTLRLYGFGYQVNYGGKYKKLQYGASHRFGSKTYSTGRGILAFSGNAGYEISKKYSIALQFDHYQQDPDLYVGGVLVPGAPRSKRDRAEMRFAISSERARFILRPYYLYQEAIMVRSATKAMALDYRPAAEGQVRFYSSVEGGFVKIYDVPDLDNFFIAQIFGSLKYKTFTTSLRYYYGPYQAIDQVRFIQSRQNPQRVAFSNYFDTWLIESRMLMKATATLNYESLFKRVGFVLRPEVAYYTKNNFVFTMYMEYLLNSSKNANRSTGQVDAADKANVLNDINIGCGIKKTFGIPLNRKNYHDVQIIVFKDMNGNGAMDNGEKAVENMLINVKTASPPDADSAAGTQIEHDKIINYELITDEKGMVAFDNLPTGFYSINVSSLTGVGGWFDTKEVPELIDRRQTVYIPLNKAARINGSIIMQRDKYSKVDGEVDLSRIRVTSTNSAGNTTTTLTGKNGEFSMFLPVGEYVIDINKGALGEGFEFVNSSVKIKLGDPNGNYTVTFYIREKKRQMNIKEFKKQ